MALSAESPASAASSVSDGESPQAWRRVRRTFPLYLVLVVVAVQMLVLFMLLNPLRFWAVHEWLEVHFPSAYSPVDNQAERATDTIFYFFLTMCVANALLVLPLPRKGLQVSLIEELRTVPDARRIRLRLLFDRRFFTLVGLAFAVPLFGTWLLDTSFGEVPFSLIISWYVFALLLAYVLSDRAVVLHTLSPGVGTIWKLAALLLIPFSFLWSLVLGAAVLVALPWALFFLYDRVRAGLNT